MLIVYPILHASVHKYSILYTIFFQLQYDQELQQIKKLHINFLDNQRNTNSFATIVQTKITINKKVTCKILDKQK